MQKQIARLFLILPLSLLGDYEVITCTASLSRSSLSTSNVHHLCISEEKVALLEFKRSFVSLRVSDDICHIFYTSPPKIQSWNEDVHTGANSTSGGDCCLWEGVECDVSTGHVIGLYLSCSQLYGAIPSDSTLFHLSHLRTLDLSLNNFNGSSISPAFGRSFPHMTDLDLSSSNFSGLIPSEIAHLSKLISLNIEPSIMGMLTLEPQAFKMLIQNLTRLEHLFLGGVNISSSIPEYIGNLSSLVEIALYSNGLYGDLPPSMLQLPYLGALLLSENDGLVGYLPKSNWNCSSHLGVLDLSGVRFSSELPDSCSPGCLKPVYLLDFSHGGFFGSIPPWLGNLTDTTDLSLHLSSNSFTGWLPFALSNLRNIIQLDLSSNSFHGTLPHWLTNLTELQALDLSSNKLTGPIPSNISNLHNLSWLKLSNNSIAGTIPLGLFALPLTNLDLSSNQLSGPIPSNITGLQIVLSGSIDLSYNYLSGTIEPLSFVTLKEVFFLDLSHNSLQGPLPLTPPSISYLLISNNKFEGDIPPSICDSSKLEILDLSHNNLSGVIPKCITNFSSTLSVLNLGMNGLSGAIPLNFVKGNRLRSINLNGNHLEGKLPRSLANCRDLEVLDLGNNNIKDTFPYWLHFFKELQVLVLRHNKLYGTVGLSGIKKTAPFPKLRIFDLSHNKFIGPLPTNYFQSLNAMRNVNSTQSATLEYMGNTNYDDTVVINWKGVEFEVQHILKVLATIDFSGNRFEGEIPNDMESLIGIQSLNLSNNVITGHIPSSLANLRLLESLDLSSNQLSGVIPQELTHITTLEVLNLSINHLTGPIPQGFQFATFQNDSYSGNLGLCGPPMSKKCSDNGAPHDHPSVQEDHDEEGGIFDGFGWKIVLLGYGCGTVFRLGVGFVMFSTGKPKRLVTFVEDELLGITNRTGNRRPQGNRNARRRG